MENKDNGPRIQSILRAASILQCFTAGSSLGVTEIAEKVGLHKSTAFGIISTLVHCGFLQQNPENGRYSVGVELFRLGQLYDRDLRRLIRPYLDALVNEFQETANYVVPEGCHIVYIEKIESPHSMRISTARGKHLPMYCTGAGKAILAYLPPQKQEEILAKTVFSPLTDQTITSRDALVQDLKRVRSRGYAIDNGEMEFGLYCIAVPVFDRDSSPCGAVSVSGPVIRMTDEIQEKISSRLAQYAGSISSLLSGLDPESFRK
ncbi:MAG: IclR family transcriptional regulator [Clostridia bacterium]|nr:IclR family transcriptional regulator [Clostridia bacterium]